GADFGHDAPPHPRRFEHVRLVDREQPPVARARQREGAAGDPLDLARVVLAGVEDGAVLADAAGAVVEAGDELAHDYEVDAVAERGPEVLVERELAAQVDQALLGPDRAAFPARAADRAEEHRVLLAAGGERLRRKRAAGGV